MGTQIENKRQANIELLRILSIIMVVSLHYFGKGQLLPSFQDAITPTGAVSYFIESFCIVAVNVFVLISGYFLSHSEFKISKLMSFWFQIVFYSLGVPIVFFILGMLETVGFSKYQLLSAVLPIQMNHYWFATSYFIMYCCSPLLNAAIKNMTKKNLQIVIGLLMIIFSVVKTIVPLPMTIDTFGYDFSWFICVYLIGAYIRMYGIPFFSSWKKCLISYVSLSVLIYVYTMVLGILSMRTGFLKDQVTEAMHYNHLFNLLSAISLFYLFLHISIKREKIANIIVRISPYVFGVYLLHEQEQLRYAWIEWFQVTADRSLPQMLLHLVACVSIIFVTGVIIDFIRTLLFNVISMMIKKYKRKKKKKNKVKNKNKKSNILK